jgi:hypothetical protein
MTSYRRIPETLPLTYAQQRTIWALVDSEADANLGLADAVVTWYGDTGAVLAIVRINGCPAPNPIVALWQYGAAYVVESEDDCNRWLAHFQECGGRRSIAIQREDDSAYVIQPGGSYEQLAS